MEEGADVGDAMTLYRAVGPGELADIESFGGYRAVDGMVEGKYFFETPEQVSKYALKIGDKAYTMTSVSVPRSEMIWASRINPADEGPGFFFSAAHIPSGPVTIYRSMVCP
jgi:hypothetical protein